MGKRIRNRSVYALSAVVVAGGVGVSVLALNSGPSKSTVRKAIQVDTAASHNAYRATSDWLAKSWCGPLSKMGTYTDKTWAAAIPSGPAPSASAGQVVNSSAPASLSSALIVAPKTDTSFVVAPIFCHYVVQFPHPLTTGGTAKNPFARPGNSVAAIDTHLPVAIGKVKYVSANVELEASYAVTVGNTLTYHHVFFATTAYLSPSGKLLSWRMPGQRAGWRSSTRQVEGPMYVASEAHSGASVKIPSHLVGIR